MNKPFAALIAALVLTLAALPAAAADRLIAGQAQEAELVGEGLVDTATSPERIVSEVGEDVRNFGPGGLATGAAAGGVKAAGQAVQGAAKVFIGVLDIITKPIRESPYNRNTTGGLRPARSQR